MSQAITAIDRSWAKLIKSTVERTGIMDQHFAQELSAALIDCPRALFFDEKQKAIASKDVSVPIGFDKIEPPVSLIVRMLGLLSPTKGERILIVGCGSGFVPAICVRLGVQTYVVETNGLLAQRTRKRLDASGFQNVLIRTGNALSGWEEFAPFHSIFVSGAVSLYPQVLSQQLDAGGGQLVCIVGAPPESVLQLGERRDSELKTYRLEKVGFR